MYINNYTKFVLNTFEKSSEFAQIKKIVSEYGITTFANDWCKVNEQTFFATRVINIALNTDIVDTFEIPSKDISNLVSTFAKTLLDTFASIHTHLTKLNDTTYKNTENYGCLTLSNGDDGDYIYLMITDY